VMKMARCPAVLDADALSMLAKSPHALDEMRGRPRLLTPHPGEMQRLLDCLPGWHGFGRRQLAEMYVRDAPQRTLLLKGARTVIATAGEVTLFNSTGHPGMASGGMGDVLSGVCGALAAQGVPLHHTAALGAWLCGRAAEHAGRESLAASDVAAHLGAAFRAWKQAAY
jgi:ADP-dependent NAD(P)H-hydrate dehydratase / NAD(P)H-hydrate epimerase